MRGVVARDAARRAPNRRKTCASRRTRCPNMSLNSENVSVMHRTCSPRTISRRAAEGATAIWVGGRTSTLGRGRGSQVEARGQLAGGGGAGCRS